MTVPSGPVVFNNDTGSDSAASGLGPDAVVAGTFDVTSGSSTLTNGVTSSGNIFDIDVGDLIYITTSSGRKFSIIQGINLSLGEFYTDDNWDVTETANWYVGGKRATLDNADSRTLFSSDIPFGAVVEIEHTGTHYTFGSLITLKAIGTTDAPVVYRGTGTSKPRIQGVVGNSEAIRPNGSVFDNLEIEGRSTTGQGLMAASYYSLFNCKLIDNSSSTANVAHLIASSSSYNNLVVNCSFVGKGGLGTAIRGYYVYGWYQTCNIINCEFSGFDTCIKIEEGNAFNVNKCVFRDSTKGFDAQSTTDRGGHCITDSIFYGLSGNAINFDGQYAVQASTVLGNIFSEIGGDCISAASAWNKASTALFDRNAFYDVSGSSYNNLSGGSDDINLPYDPFVDASNGDFRLNKLVGGGAGLRNFKLARPN